jgi:proteic killer suppression protein
MHAMIAIFADGASEDLFSGVASRRAQRACPQPLWPVARRKLDQLNRVRSLGELRVSSDNRLGRLAGGRAGQHGVRINEQFRICFRWEDGHAYDVEVTDYH